MKKILSLLIALGSITAVFAQGGHDRNESRDIVLGQSNNRGYDHNVPVYDNHNTGNYNTRERDMQIQRINHEFDMRVNAIERDRYLRNGEKRRQISQLERQRQDELRQVNDRFSHGSYDQRRNDRRY